MKQLRQIKCQIRSLLTFSGTVIVGEFDNGIWSRRFKEWLQNLPITGNNRLALNSMLRRLNFLYDEFLSVERQIRAYARTHHTEEYKRLLSIPGIGPVVSIAVLSELGDYPGLKKSIISVVMLD